MLDVDDLKRQVINIILGPSNNFMSNAQYLFACGIAINAILFSKDCDDYVISSIMKEVEAHKEPDEMQKFIIDIIEANISYIEHLPPYRKKLFDLILN